MKTLCKKPKIFSQLFLRKQTEHMVLNLSSIPFLKVFDFHLYMFKAVLLCLIAKMIKFIYFPRKFQSHITKMLEVNQN